MRLFPTYLLASRRRVTGRRPQNLPHTQDLQGRLAWAPQAPGRSPADRRLLANEDGSAAIEFALVGLPFVLFVVGILGYGLYFLTSTYLEYGAEIAARKIRTGEINSGGANGNAMTVGEFRSLVCKAAKPVIDCGKLNVIVQHGTDWSGISPQACVGQNGGMTGATGATGEMLSKYAGEASEVVLVTLCYKWDLANNLSFLKLGSGKDGAGPAIIQAATAFKSEPYSN